MTLQVTYNNGIFALSKSVPELDGLVTGCRDNLSVITREGNRKHILGVTSEASIGTTQYKNVGVSASGAQSAYDVNSPVNFIFTRSPTSSNYTVQLYSNPNSHSTVFRVAIVFKMFDINQANHPWLSAY